MSLKTLIAGTVHQVGAITGFSLSRAKSIRAGRILMFHGVGDSDLSLSDFESHLQFLTKHFSVVSLEAMVRKLGEGKQLTNEVALTFDDGLRNNLTLAFPVLKRLNLPATFFVCPALIESRRWLWNHEVRARLQSLTAGQLKNLHTRLNAPCDSEVESIVTWMKTLSLKVRETVEETVREESSSFRPNATQQQKCDMMNWDELASLPPELITIGSHTVNHPILSTLDDDQLRFEISESRRWLEKKLGRKVEQFCYPNGSHNPAVVEEVRKHYRIAVTTEPGFVDGAKDLVQLPRLGIVPQPLFGWRLHRPTA